MAHLLDESSLGVGSPCVTTALGAAERWRPLLCKGAQLVTNPGAAPGKWDWREAAQPSPDEAEGTVCAAGHLLFPCLTMANLLVTSQFWERNITS